jgi:hypothetical protein
MSDLEDLVRAIVREELGALGVQRVYTSTSLPPGVTSREHFAAECRRLRIGEKHGRVWTVDANVWRSARAAARKTKHAPAPAMLEDQADRLLEASRLRLVGRR